MVTSCPRFIGRIAIAICTACGDKFTARIGTLMERSHIPLHKWLPAFRLMASSKKGVSAHQKSA
jgi:hypothetical protein